MLAVESLNLEHYSPRDLVRCWAWVPVVDHCDIDLEDHRDEVAHWKVGNLVLVHDLDLLMVEHQELEMEVVYLAAHLENWDRNCWVVQIEKGHHVLEEEDLDY